MSTFHRPSSLRSSAAMSKLVGEHRDARGSRITEALRRREEARRATLTDEQRAEEDRVAEERKAADDARMARIAAEMDAAVRRRRGR